MTLVEALHATENVLNDISVPVGLRKQIADPIEMALKNLSEIIKAIENADAKAAEERENSRPAVTEDQI